LCEKKLIHKRDSCADDFSSLCDITHKRDVDVNALVDKVDIVDKVRNCIWASDRRDKLLKHTDTTDRRRFGKEENSQKERETTKTEIRRKNPSTCLRQWSRDWKGNFQIRLVRYFMVLFDSSVTMVLKTQVLVQI